MTRSAGLRILLAISILLVSYLLGKAQPPDPRAPDTTSNAGTGTAETEVAKPVVRSPATQAVIGSLAATDPQTPTQLFQAIVVLRQFEEYEEAKQYLTKLSGLDSAQLAELHGRLGTAAFVQLSRDVGMAPEGRDFTLRVFQAVKEVRRDPATVQGAIEALASQSADEKRRALSTLAAAGPDAVPALLAAWANPPSGVTAEDLRQALVAMGAYAEEPLIAALSGPDVSLQTEAAIVLGYVGSSDSAASLLRPLYTGNPGLRRAAAEALDRMEFSAFPSVPSALEFLKRETLRYLRNASSSAEEKLELWTWDAQRNNVVRSQLNGQEAAIVLASRRARDLYEIDPTADNARLLLVSRLESEQRIVGLDEQLPRGAGSAYQLGADLGVAAINGALTYGLAEGLDAACIGACELLGEFGGEELLLGERWSPLIVGLKSGNRRVRYAAARALITIDPRRTFPGSSFLLETLIDLANSAGVPNAVIGSPRDDTSDLLSGELATFGYDVQRGANGKSFLGLAVGSSDHDVFFVSDAIHAPPASEVLQQVRLHERGKSTPVILLSRKGGAEAAERLAARDPLVIVMPEFADEVALSLTLNRARMLVAGLAVPPERRLEQAADALQWLVHLTQYSQSYAWYDFSRAHDVAASAIYVDGLASDAIDLLGYTGLASSQQVLVDTASSTGLPVDRRQRAANAFTEAVLRRGLLLRAAEVSRQYARYNASKTADASTQAILGQILDTIEARTQSEL